MGDERKDLAYWRDVAFIGLGVLSAVAGLGHISDWHAAHKPTDLKIAVGFLLLLPLLFALSRRKLELLLGILFTFILFGAIGTILRQSLAAVPYIILCAILAYILLRWKGKELARSKSRR